MAIHTLELESNQTKLEAVRVRLVKQRELLTAYENGHTAVGGTTFPYSSALITAMKVAFVELRSEIIELENAITE